MRVGKDIIKKGDVKMIHKIKGVSVSEFKKSAGIYYPYESKKLIKNGEVIARYSAKTKRVKVIK